MITIIVIILLRPIPGHSIHVVLYQHRKTLTVLLLFLMSHHHIKCSHLIALRDPRSWPWDIQIRGSSLLNNKRNAQPLISLN